MNRTLKYGLNKSEIRNPKSETSTNDQNSNDKNKCLGFLSLRFRICFDIRYSIFGLLVFLGVLIFAAPNVADASTMSLSPSLGTYEVGETFDVEIVVDTEGAIVNTVWALLQFPPDALQIVSPSTGTSIIGIWTRAPRFDNTRGTIELQGVIPGGINTRKGLVTTVTFRVKRPGNALIRFLDESAVLLHDGQGTPSLRDTRNASYNLILPPPEGPIVTSSTHPEQDEWYSNSSVALAWKEPEGVEGFSYVLDQDPTTKPDDISEGIRSGVDYASIGDGTHYFHIKALREDAWGGVTHFAVNIDTTAPAEFDIDIAPSARTSSTRPIINFVTTDGLSGLSRYELKIVSLKDKGSRAGFFIETISPYTTELELGDYDVIVRAYDNAGNYRESVQRLEIATYLFNIISDKGIEVQGKFIIPWWFLFLLLFILFVILGFIGWRAYRKHMEADAKVSSGELAPDVQTKLKELQDYKQKYGSMMVLLLALASLLFMQSGAVLAQHEDDGQAEAHEEAVALAPPAIDTVSRDITNEDIFYVGGRVNVAGAEAVLLLQNMTTGETISRAVKADENGEWFYRHDSFLSAGKYLIWAQSRSGGQMSPPSPQVQMTVHATALQFGSSRISYATLFLVLALIMLIANTALVIFVLHHRKHAKQKHSRFMKEVEEAEESIRRGFAVLRRDIQAELNTIKKAKVGKGLSVELEQREKDLMADLEDIEQKIGKEIWDVERSEHKD